MKKVSLIATGLFALALICGGKAAKAEAITDLFNTGAGLAVGAQDTNYQVVTGTTTAPMYVAQNSAGFPYPKYWMDNTADSKWLSIDAKAYDSDPVGDYVIRYVFNLDESKFNPATAEIAGRWSADNIGTGIFLNGTEVPGTSTRTDGYAFKEWTNYDIASGFKAGENVLEFHVTNINGNAANPMGFRNEMSGTIAAIPEPAFFQLGTLLMGSGLMALRLRKRQAA